MKKGLRLLKRMAALFLMLLLSIESFGAVVSDNDGSAFITKAEFDSLKNDFQAQIDQYNTSIDSKIDGAIAAYLAGIKVETQTKLKNYFDSIPSSSLCRNFKDLSTAKLVFTQDENIGSKFYVQARVIGINSAANTNNSKYNRGMIRMNINGSGAGNFVYLGESNENSLRAEVLKVDGDEYPYFDDETSLQYEHKQYSMLDLVNAGVGGSVTSTPVNMYNSNYWNNFSLANDFDQPKGEMVDWASISGTNGWPWSSIPGVKIRYDTWDQIADTSTAKNEDNIPTLCYSGMGKVNDRSTDATEDDRICWVDKSKQSEFTVTRSMTSSELTSYGGNPGVVYNYRRTDYGEQEQTTSKTINFKEISILGAKYTESALADIILYDPSKILNQPVYKYNGLPIAEVTKKGKVTFAIASSQKNGKSTRIVISNDKFDNAELSETTNKKLYDETTTFTSTNTQKTISIDLSDRDDLSYPFTLWVKVYNESGETIDVPGNVVLTTID